MTSSLTRVRIVLIEADEKGACTIADIAEKEVMSFNHIVFYEGVNALRQRLLASRADNIVEVRVSTSLGWMTWDQVKAAPSGKKMKTLYHHLVLGKEGPLT